ncbi:hypothetical protein PsorP6_017527 [Peronosclerospora sorghi]|uniref:Uncharacterized protein n=1 Tax=Peronosclerospora sorghi TaxID=230839 RepID=A0ACC0WNU0_9STRA|nr:hypothetical protein PsorP6_017527 [Peronosclerospora sorghi]
MKVKEKCALKRGQLRTDVLSSVETVHATTDFWTSGANDPYCGVTLHLLSLSGTTIETVDVRTKLVPYPHTSVGILSTLRFILEEEGLISKVSFVTSDNGSNVVKAFENTEFVHIRCDAHSLELVVRHGVEHDSLADFLEKVRGLNVLLSKPKQEQYLRDAQVFLGVSETDRVYVIKAADTRLLRLREAIERYKAKLESDIAVQQAAWNSFKAQKTTRMLPGFIKPVKPTCCERLDPHTRSDEWRLLADLVNLLNPFEAVTVQLGGSYYSTFSTVIPCRYKLNTHLIERRNISGVHPSVSRVAGAMYNIFDDKWKATCVHAFVARYLYPRFKIVVKKMDTYFVGPAKKLLAEMIEEKQDRQREGENETPTN